jgi:amino acid adenylation domain-containing protein
VRNSTIRPGRSFVEFKKEDIEQSLPQRFEKQVAKYPQRAALKFKSVEVTYEALNKAANCVAHFILAGRDADQEPIALLIEEGSAAVAAILGILKAGKIYVAIDPSDPKSSIQYTLADAQINLIITDNKDLALSNELADGGLRVLNIDAIEHAPHSAANPKISISPDSLAYIFYTSGSTGRPKGVVDNHRNVLHNIMRYTNSLKIAPEDRLTLLQSLSFSGSVSSLFGALLNGATSCLFSLKKEGAKRMAGWLSDENITIYHSVPSMFRLIATGESHYPALRIIRLEGDQSSPEDIDLYKQYFSDSCVLVNGLGATECGIVRQFFVDKSTPTPGTVVPVGYDVEDMGVLLLDEAGQEVGLGSIGEIAIESRYLAQGYWRRPDLTRAAFPPHPQCENRRIYRTGDLGRFQLDGCLEYLGRKNFQMKIRGQWVETAAVEKALHEFGYFKDIEVFTRAEDLSKPILVAYLVPKETPAPAASAIRRFLAKRLPAHMVPTSYVFLDHLPISANRKIDRRALPAPSHARPDTAIPFTPPENPYLQRHLQKIWEDVLGIHPIGIRNDFFDLGGDSLQALIMMAAVEKETETRVPPAVLLADPTIKALADYIQAKDEEKKLPLVAIQKGGEKRPFYFLHGDYISGGFYCRRIAHNLESDRPFYAMPPCGLNGYPALDSYQAMAAVHVQELRAYQPVGPYMLGGTCNGGLVAYEMARQLFADGQKVDLLVLIAATASNLRFRKLKRLLRPIRLLLPNGANYEDRLFGRLQPFLTKLSETPIKRYPQFVWSKRTRISEELRTILPQLKRVSCIQGAEIISMNEVNNSAADKIIFSKIYHQIDREYMPGKYPGKVTLFWANGESECPETAVRWWREIAEEVDLHILPGTPHTESLTVHADEVAKMLMSCIEAVEARSGGAWGRAPQAAFDVKS